MFAVFKREFLSYFRTPVGWIAICLMGIISGYYFTGMITATFPYVNIALEIKPITVRQAQRRGETENQLSCDRLNLNAGGEKLYHRLACGQCPHPQWWNPAGNVVRVHHPPDTIRKDCRFYPWLLRHPLHTHVHDRISRHHTLAVRNTRATLKRVTETHKNIIYK